VLAKSGEEITIGEIVKILEGGINLMECIENREICDRASECLIRDVWIEVTKTIEDKLNSMTRCERGTTLNNQITKITRIRG
jgi:DNA-binding IscR family transcriptional regulator